MRTEGPTKTTRLSCIDCIHEHSVKYVCQGDSGHDVYCGHPDAPKIPNNFIGDSTWRTPDWCPILRSKK